MDPQGNPPRFQTLIAVLIAMVTVTGAIVAWRAATISSEADDAEREGLLSTIVRERVDATNRTWLYNDLRTFALYTEYQALADRLAQDAQAHREAGDEDEADRLAQEAERYRLLSDNLRRFLFEGYITSEGTYDANAFLARRWAEAAREADLEPQDDLALADTLRLRAQRLVGGTIFLAAALLLLTLAQISRSGLRYLFLAGGVTLYLIVLSGLLIIG
ncbi:MAG: hypothetical protein D6759_10780 [Chloroflexi bacterium]|nr:MAG: hypothetical protein D6759_10780 [Chloroflexota bacterium]